MSGLVAVWRAFYSRRELVRELAKRELRDRHTGQALGAVWAYGQTLFLMVTYTLLFAYVFPTRFASSQTSIDFSVNVLAGVLAWLAFQDILARSSSILLAHSNLVKQIVFPTEVLPIKTTLASLLPYSAGLIFALAYAGWKDTLSWFSLTLPFIILCQVLAMVGIAFFFSAIGVFLRDLRDIVTIFCTVNLFAQPILYNPMATPEWLKWVFYFNPFSYLVWCWQDALYYGYMKHTFAWMVLPLGSLTVLIIGWKTFERMKHSFGDSL